MTRKRYEVRRLRAAMLPLLLLGVPSGSASAQPAEAAEIERLYTTGQDRYAQKDYAGAVEAWTQLLDLLPEEPNNRLTRESVAVNIGEAHVAAYEHLRGDDGERDAAHLQRALAFLDAYEATLREAYGASTTVPDFVARLRADIEQRLNPPDTDDVGPCLQPCLQPPCLSPIEPRGCGGKQPATAFVLLGVLGLGTRRRRDAITKLEGSLPADVVARLRARLDRDET